MTRSEHVHLVQSEDAGPGGARGAETSASQARPESSEGVELQQARVPLQDPADQRAGERQQGTARHLDYIKLYWLTQ